MGFHSRIVLVSGNFQTSKMKLFVIFAAFICLANATEEANKPTVAEKAFKALKAIQGDLFTVADTNAYKKENDEEKKKVREAFANNFELGEDDKENLMEEIEDHPNLIDDLKEAKNKKTAADLQTQMDSNDELKKALEFIAESKLATSSASAIGISGLLVFSLFMLH